MANSDRGTKRTCQHCEVKFYDLNKEPIICPKCGEEFIIETVTVVPELKQTEVNESPEEKIEIIDENIPEIISLDDVEDAENEGEDIPDLDEVEVDDDINADQQDTFLEEDDDDTKIDLVVPTTIIEE